MPDDNQNDQLAKITASNAAANHPTPYQAIANQTVTEPRSAVEAASSQGHGGSNPDSPLGQPVFTGQPYPSENAVPDSLVRDMQRIQWSGKPTLANGIKRVSTMAEDGMGLISDLEGYVEGLRGKLEPHEYPDPSKTDGKGAIGELHNAAEHIEYVFRRLADLVKRAKAAHG